MLDTLYFILHNYSMFSAHTDPYWPFLTQYSGIILIWITFLFVIVPFFIVRKKKKHKIKSIAEIAQYPFFGKIFTTGLILSGLVQITFLSYLTQKVNGIFPQARLIFSIGSACLVLSCFISTKISPKFHKLLFRLYFILVNIGAFLLSISLALINFHLSIVGCYLTAIMLFGAFLFRLRKKNLQAESWNFALTCIWIGAIYFLI